MDCQPSHANPFFTLSVSRSLMVAVVCTVTECRVLITEILHMAIDSRSWVSSKLPEVTGNDHATPLYQKYV